MDNELLNLNKEIQKENQEFLKDQIKSCVHRYKIFEDGKNKDWKDTEIFKLLLEHIKTEISSVPPIKFLEDILNHFKRKRDKILYDELPQLLGGAGLSEITTDDGIKVKLEQYISPESMSKMPLKQKSILILWLQTNGYKYNIKESFDFAKGEVDKELRDFLQKKGYSYNTNVGVNAQTLKKIMKDRIEKGEELPPENICKIKIFDRVKIK